MSGGRRASCWSQIQPFRCGILRCLSPRAWLCDRVDARFDRSACAGHFPVILCDKRLRRAWRSRGFGSCRRSRRRCLSRSTDRPGVGRLALEADHRADTRCDACNFRRLSSRRADRRSDAQTHGKDCSRFGRATSRPSLMHISARISAPAPRGAPRICLVVEEVGQRPSAR
jgi:hypothetical protein